MPRTITDEALEAAIINKRSETKNSVTINALVRRYIPASKLAEHALKRNPRFIPQSERSRFLRELKAL